ncbi:MAG TPA: PspC domain-containing protein [Chryseosolibacter sp.]|nr:PspC domain-containing protein [Chryseosolibacter sp.]
MKKNISINISGIIFHIEEDGYETLKKYLDSINKYFSTFEDSSEILADIESRIAEIFLSKLNEEKQVITSEDVSSLVLTMGSVSDFKAAEDAGQREPEQAYSGTEPGPEASTSGKYTPPRQLMRDQKRKILGGVCAGLANYFNVDALWIRLLFAILTFAYGFTLLVYIVMWALVPGSYDLDEPIVSKKMYRDPERKIIGGVAGGVAAYLGIDIIASRLLFIIFTIAGGLGLFIYIVLWIILPEARTLTDKMQMQGEPVTLSNIESTLKKSQSEKPAQEESTLTKVILFPFRLLGMILTALGRVLSPLMEVIRVGIGVIIVLTGMAMLFALVVTAGVLIGILSAGSFTPWMSELNETSFPVDAFLRAFPSWTAVAAFFATVVPTVFLILLGISVIAKRVVINAATGWTLFVLFFVSCTLLAVGIPKIAMAFREDAEYRVENVYRIEAKRAVFRLNETGMDDYDVVDLELKGHSGKDFRLVQTFEAQGSSRAKAIENAKMVDYNVDVRDSVLTFDTNLRFKEDAVFRAQRLHMTLFIPYNFPFTMDEAFSRFIQNHVDFRQMDGNTWQITEDGLKCVSCPVSEDDATDDLVDFDEIEIRGKFDVRIIPSPEYSVVVRGTQVSKERYSIHRAGETLVIDYEGKKEIDWKVRDLNIEEVEILIYMPRIEKIEAIGVGSVRLDDFTTDDLEIDLRGPVKLRGEITAQNLNITLTGAAEAELSGDTQNMNARLELASKLRAYNLRAADAFVETSGGSSAKVYVTQTLEMERGIASDIDYRGKPNSVIRRD